MPSSASIEVDAKVIISKWPGFLLHTVEIRASATFRQPRGMAQPWLSDQVNFTAASRHEDRLRDLSQAVFGSPHHNFLNA